MLILSIILLLNPFVRIEQSKDVPIKLTGVISLPGVAGRIDHLVYNSDKGIIYVAALGNNTVEVVDLKNKKVVHSIKGLDEPQGIIYIPETNSIVVANGGNGELNVFNAANFQRVKSVKLGDDADNIRYDPITNMVYIGYGSGTIAALDAVSFKQLSDIELPGHPESFQLLNGAKIIVNIPDAHLLDVIDLKQNKIISKWQIQEASANFPMALSITDNRIYVGCRRPAKMLVLDSQTGKIISSLDIDGDTDDIFLDSSAKQIYVSCGGGYVDVFSKQNPDKYELVSRIESRPGARTSLFIPELNQLVVAAPSHSGKEAQLMIYSR